MNEWEKENSELNIDDILKEFGDIMPAQEELEEDVRIWGEEAPEVPAHQEVLQDTVRLDEITKVIKSQTTVSEDTIAFTPIEQEAEEEYLYVPRLNRKPSLIPRSGSRSMSSPLGNMSPRSLLYSVRNLG